MQIRSLIGRRKGSSSLILGSVNSGWSSMISVAVFAISASILMCLAPPLCRDYWSWCRRKMDEAVPLLMPRVLTTLRQSFPFAGASINLRLSSSDTLVRGMGPTRKIDHANNTFSNILCRPVQRRYLNCFRRYWFLKCRLHSPLSPGLSLLKCISVNEAALPLVTLILSMMIFVNNALWFAFPL